MKYSNDKGSIYIMVIIILAIVLMMLSMLTIIAGRDLRTSDLYSDGIKAYYIAYSGIAEGISWAKTDPKTNKSLTSGTIAAYHTSNYSLTWTATYSSTDKSYTINSTGAYKYNNNITLTRKLKAVVRVQGGLVEVDSLIQEDNIS